MHMHNPKGAITCQTVQAPEDGTIVSSSTAEGLPLGTVAIYSCNTGFALVGQLFRVCEDTNGGTVTTGTWSGSAPRCQGIVK